MTSFVFVIGPAGTLAQKTSLSEVFAPTFDVSPAWPWRAR
jgi:hypothetical protein